jgi:hypothetical protein
MKLIVARDMHYKPFVHLYAMIMRELVIHNQKLYSPFGGKKYNFLFK